MAAKRPARASLRYAKAPLSPRYPRELHQLLGHCSKGGSDRLMATANSQEDQIVDRVSGAGEEGRALRSHNYDFTAERIAMTGFSKEIARQVTCYLRCAQ